MSTYTTLHFLRHIITATMTKVLVTMSNTNEMPTRAGNKYISHCSITNESVDLSIMLAETEAAADDRARSVTVIVLVCVLMYVSLIVTLNVVSVHTGLIMDDDTVSYIYKITRKRHCSKSVA